MDKTLEQLIGDTAYSQHCSGMMEVVPKSEVLKLLKQVRQATLAECAMKARWYYNGPAEYLFHYQDDIDVNRTELLNLDLNSIEL